MEVKYNLIAGHTCDCLNGLVIHMTVLMKFNLVIHVTISRFTKLIDDITLTTPEIENSFNSLV